MLRLLISHIWTNLNASGKKFKKITLILINYLIFWKFKGFIVYFSTNFDVLTLNFYKLEFIDRKLM